MTLFIIAYFGPPLAERDFRPCLTASTLPGTMFIANLARRDGEAFLDKCLDYMDNATLHK